jgi:hypothetical protein
MTVRFLAEIDIIFFLSVLHSFAVSHKTHLPHGSSSCNMTHFLLALLVVGMLASITALAVTYTVHHACVPTDIHQLCALNPTFHSYTFL